MDAIDDKGQPVDLASLSPGEAMVRVLRGTLRYPPDHTSIARANHKIANWQPPARGAYHSSVVTAAQKACVEGDA